MSDLPWMLLRGAEQVYVNPAASFMVLDFETTNLEKGSPLNPENSIVLSCWTIYHPDGTKESKHIFGDEYSIAELLEDVNSVSFVVAQNSKFEMQWLKRAGLDLRTVLFYDTML